MTRDLSARRVGVALGATVENKRLCMRNKILRSANAKSNFSFNEINKIDLPVIYFIVFRCLLFVLLFFRLYCIINVTPFIRRSLKRSKISVFYFSYKVFYF